MECFWELKRDKAPGIDGVTWGEYEENLDENVEDLVVRLKAKRYRPQPVISSVFNTAMKPERLQRH